MALKLDDMLKKAVSKGIQSASSNISPILRPWQQESVLFDISNSESKNELPTSIITTENIKDEHEQLDLAKLAGKSKVSYLENSKDNVIGYKKGNILEYDTFLYELMNLKGLKEKIFFYVLDMCLAHGKTETGPINTSKMAHELNCPYGTLKTIINRLVKKGFLIRLKGKRSSLGYINLMIDRETQEVAFKAKRNSIHKDNNKDNTLGYMLGNKLQDKIDNTPIQEIPIGIDITPLKSINFTEAHLKQILALKVLEDEAIQESIYAFAFDLNENKKMSSLKTNPLNYFIGILRKGQPYLPPSNYESPKDKALREYVERKRELSQKRVKLEQEALDLAFLEWKEKLTIEEKNKIYPNAIKKLKDGTLKINFLKNFFKENIWSHNDVD